MKQKLRQIDSAVNGENEPQRLSPVKDEGLVLFHRRVRHDWKFKNPLYRSAWFWLLIHAEWKEYGGLKRGQVRFAVSQAPTLWGMSNVTAARFLRKCVADGSIIWEKGRLGPKGKRSPYLLRETIRDTKAGLITICNYDYYQAVSRWLLTNRETKRDTLTKTLSKTSTKSTSPSAPDRPTGAPTKKISRKRKRPKTKRDPNVKTLIDYFCPQYQQRFNHKYTVSGKRDGQIFKDLLEDHSLVSLQECIATFFDDPDPWLDGKRTIPILKIRINEYVQRLATKANEPVPPAYRRLED